LGRKGDRTAIKSQITQAMIGEMDERKSGRMSAMKDEGRTTHD
jgi:hypothetical protein